MYLFDFSCVDWANLSRGVKYNVILKMEVTRVLRVFRNIGLLLNAPYKIDSMVWMRLC
jgi:hypothetical protein